MSEIDALVAPNSKAHIEKWRNLHLNQSCILVCNGPSLNQVDFKKIDRKRFKVFGLNKIYLGFEKFGLTPDYLVAVNKKVIEQAHEAYNSLSIPKFISNRVSAKALDSSSNYTIIKTTGLPADAERFSTDISEYVNEGWTVTHAALQIIYYMGFKEVHIIGLDHNFRQHVLGKENASGIIHGADIDHFCPDYFGFGQEWDLPDLKNSEISFREAKRVFERNGGNIFDCTIGGHCNIFEKMPLSRIYIENERATEKKQSEFAVDLTIGVLNDTKIDEIESFICSIRSYFDINIEIFIVSLEAGNAARWYPHVNEKLQVIDLYGATIDEAARVVLTNAKGEFVQFVTPNCVLSDNFIDHTVSYLRKNPQVDFVAGQTLFATESGHELSPYHLGSHVPNQSIVSKTAALTEALSNSESHKVDSQAGLHELLCREQRGHKLPEAITYYRFNGNCRHHHMMLWLTNFASHYSSFNFEKGETFCEEDWEIRNTFTQFLASMVSGDTITAQQLLLMLIAPSNARMKKYNSAIDLRFELFDALFQINFDTCLNDKSQISKGAINQVLHVCKQVNLNQKMPKLLSYILYKLVDLDSVESNFSEVSHVKLGVSFPREKRASVDEAKLIASLFSAKEQSSQRVLIDVGAHTGTVTQIFRDLDWKVYAFEPDPNNLKYFLEKFKGDESVILEQKLVLEKESQKVQFYVSEESSGISSTVNFHHTHQPIGEFEATTLRAVYSRNELKHANFLKIDVEGADFSVLKGFPWEHDKPDVILCEFEDRKTLALGHSWKTVCQYLAELGYTLFVSEWHPIERYGISHDWCGLWEWPCELNSHFAWGNLIAFANAPDKKQLERSLQQSIFFR